MMPPQPGARRRAHAVSNRWPGRQDCTARQVEAGRDWARRTRKRGCRGRMRRVRGRAGGCTPPTGSRPRCTRAPPVDLLLLCAEQERVSREGLLGCRRRVSAPVEEQRASKHSRRRKACARGLRQRCSKRVMRAQRFVRGGCICMACAQDRLAFSRAVTFSVVKWCSESRVNTRAGDDEHLVVREGDGRDAERAAHLHRKSLCNRTLHRASSATASVTASDGISA